MQNQMSLRYDLVHVKNLNKHLRSLLYSAWVFIKPLGKAQFKTI